MNQIHKTQLVSDNKREQEVSRENISSETIISGIATTFKLDPWFVTGFCDGEATFTYHRCGPKNVALVFAVKLIASDSELLFSLQRYFGVGNMYKVKAIPPGKYAGYTKPSVYYRVTKAEHLLRVIEHFDQYTLQGKKRFSYEVWRKAVLLKQNKRHVDGQALNKLLQQLSELQGRRFKTTIHNQKRQSLNQSN